MIKFKKVLGVASTVAAVFVLGSTSSFAAVDVGAINETVTDVATIGAAIMGVLVAVAGVKYVRRAL